MSLRKLLRHEASMSRPAVIIGEDDFGEPIYGAETSTTFRCRLEAVKGIETRDGGLIAIDKLQLYLPPDVDPLPTAADVVTVDGKKYSLQGNPAPVDNPRTNRVSYFVADVSATT